MRWRGLRAAALVALTAYVLAWFALGSYELTRIPWDGIALDAVTAAVAISMTFLVRVGPRPATSIWSGITWFGVCGALLLFPLAFPIGVGAAWFLLTGVLGQPHSLLRAVHPSHEMQAALAYGFLVVLPILAGTVFLAGGGRPRSAGLDRQRDVASTSATPDLLWTDAR